MAIKLKVHEIQIDFDICEMITKRYFPRGYPLQKLEIVEKLALVRKSDKSKYAFEHAIEISGESHTIEVSFIKD